MADGGDKAPLLVVNLKSDEEQVGQILAILGRLNIAVDVLEPAASTRERATVVLRIPPDRLVEAVLALEYHGFSRVRAYRRDLEGD